MLQIAEQLEFDFQFGCSGIDAEYYRDGAVDLIQKLVPRELLEEKGICLPAARARFADMLPLISWSDLSKAPCAFSALLLCKYRLNACNFFYDMISRWLLPQKRVNVELFFASDVRLPHLSDDLLSVAEVVVHLKSARDVEEVRRNLHAVETEIRLGIISSYHARRILEFKGLSSDGKTAMIQEKIGSLIHSHSKDFDKGIFAQMQQFLVNCSDSFKSERSYHHISRIISNLYALRKLLRQSVETCKTKRHIQVKFLKTQLASQPNNHVLGVLVGFNFLSDHEVFETPHLLAAIQKHHPEIRSVEGSAFVDRMSEEGIETLYLEVEKPSHSDFTLEEVQLFRTSLPLQIKSHIECFAHPLFMPRNEEEVLRGIMALSHQVRFAKDVPHVILSFDEQKGSELCFTVIVVRVHAEGAPSLQDLLASSSLKYFPDRVRRLGHVRKKYIKEATVFRTKVESKPFLRPDGSVDLVTARQKVFGELRSSLVEVRDYNGGMMYKQSELLMALKKSLGRIAEPHQLLVERFYYALNPIEMRTALEVEPLKQFFLLFLQATKTDFDLHKKKGEFLCKQDSKRAMCAMQVDREQKQAIYERIAALAIPPHQLVFFSTEVGESSYSGYLLLTEEESLQKTFFSVFDDVLS